MTLQTKATASPAKPSVAVVEAVAEKRSRDPTDLEEPLFEAVDPEALDRLFSDASPGSETGPVRVEFTYCGCQVVVHADGRVNVDR